MRLLDQADLKHLLSHLTEGMVDYMEEGTANYSKEDVARCREILAAHATALEELRDRGAAMDLVKSTVIQLNKLNEEAGEDLIETDQREQICEFIIKAGAK